VFQKPALWPHLTVRQNIAFGLVGWSRQLVEARVDEILQAMRLDGLGKRLPHQLSSGEAQRSALGRALAPKPRILLLDEPFANLDPELRAAMLSLMKRIRLEEPVTLILVAHNLDTAAICERRVTLQSGRVIEISSEQPEG
jgi:ABC-type sulfate/molybdate transport systems ATPase subunit